MRKFAGVALFALASFGFYSHAERPISDQCLALSYTIDIWVQRGNYDLAEVFISIFDDIGC